MVVKILLDTSALIALSGLEDENLKDQRARISKPFNHLLIAPDITYAHGFLGPENSPFNYLLIAPQVDQGILRAQAHSFQLSLDCTGGQSPRPRQERHWGHLSIIS